MHQHQIIFHHLDVRNEFFAWIYTLVRADPWEEIRALLIQPRAEGQNEFLLFDVRQAAFALGFDLSYGILAG